MAYLLPSVLGATRPLYVCPAMMERDVAVEFGLMYRTWHGPDPKPYPVLSYELLSNPSSGEQLSDTGEVLLAGRLERLAPNLIILDESHKCANTGAAVTKRVKAYVRAHPDEFPEAT